MSAEAAGTTVFNTLVSDIQDGVTVSGKNITGTSKFLDTGDIAAYWGDGNFIALKFSGLDANASSVKVGLRPTYPRGTDVPVDDDSGLVEIINDPDKNGVFMLHDVATQKFKVVTTVDGKTKTDVYDLSGIVCESI